MILSILFITLSTLHALLAPIIPASQAKKQLVRKTRNIKKVITNQSNTASFHAAFLGDNVEVSHEDLAVASGVSKLNSQTGRLGYVAGAMSWHAWHAKRLKFHGRCHIFLFFSFC
jgi:hypothetical protein